MIDTLLADPPCTRADARRGRRELPKSAERAYPRVVSRMDRALSQPASGATFGLQEARKAAKRLRYAAERSDPHWVSRPSGYNAVSRRFKQLLGKYQNTVVSRPVLCKLAGQPHLDGGNGFTYGLMHATETNRATRAEPKLPARWPKCASSKRRGLNSRQRPH